MAKGPHNYDHEGSVQNTPFKLVRRRESLPSFAEARQTIRRAFKDDPELRQGYVTDITSFLSERCEDQNDDDDAPGHLILDVEKYGGCSGLANRLLNLIFGE